jgi:hypothetical protein
MYATVHKGDASPRRMVARPQTVVQSDKPLQDQPIRGSAVEVFSATEENMTPFARRLELARIREQRQPDSFRAARGIALGAALGAVIWGVALWFVLV